MRKIFFVIPLIFLLFQGIQSQPAMKGPEAIRKADGDWLKAIQSKDLVRVLAFYRDDAEWLLRDTPPIVGKKGIQTTWSGLFAMPGSWIQWDPRTADVSVSGDLGYSMGTYEMRFSDQKGKEVIQKGSYVTVWKRDVDGAWKLAVDISN
jgi:ketosteroid isomerase-like protein